MSDHFGDLVNRIMVDLTEYLGYLNDVASRTEGMEPDVTALLKHIEEVKSVFGDVSGWIDVEDEPHIKLLMEWPTPNRSS